MNYFKLCFLLYFFVFLISGCASKIYQDGHPYQDKSIHIQYGKDVSIHYALGIYKSIDDEGEKLTLPSYVPCRENLKIDTNKIVKLAFDGYINNYKNKKLSIYLCFNINKINHDDFVSRDIWLFDTSLDTRKFLIKCPLIKGSNTYCFLKIKSEERFDLVLPGINYSVENK